MRKPNIPLNLSVSQFYGDIKTLKRENVFRIIFGHFPAVVNYDLK
jgi:hypothetical protein